MDEDIEQLRNKIAEIDEEICCLIADRMSVARRIGLLKHSSEKKVRNADVEKKVKDRVEKKAAELGIPKDLVKGIYESIIDASVEEQEKLKERLKEQAKKGPCAIYGGAGGMGRLISELLLLNGYQPIAIRSNGSILSYPTMEKVELPEDPEFIVVSVPMRIAGDIIERAAKKFPNKTIYEICSMKSHLKKSISKAEASGCKVISLHPMFGAAIRTFRGLPVLFCGDKDSFRDDPIWTAFEAEGAKLSTVLFDSHDRLMSYILQFTHLVNIIYFTVLSNSSVDIKKLELAASPICNRQLTNAKTVARQDPELYLEIQQLSDHLGRIYEEFGGALAELVQALASNTSKDFRELMEKGKNYFEGGTTNG